MWNLQKVRHGRLPRVSVLISLLALVMALTACSVERQVVVLQPAEGSDSPTEDLFSVALPPEWKVKNPQAGGDSWSGTLSSDDITLNFLGGPYAVSDIYRALAGGGDSLMQSKHINFSQEINGQQAILVRPRRAVENGLTGMVLDFPKRRVVFTALGLSKDEQDVAFEIFQSVRQEESASAP